MRVSLIGAIMLSESRSIEASRGLRRSVAARKRVAPGIAELLSCVTKAVHMAVVDVEQKVSTTSSLLLLMGHVLEGQNDRPCEAGGRPWA
ncbi:MAG: hypothetical protein R3B47_21090 [Bacteroidia bacterium]